MTDPHIGVLTATVDQLQAEHANLTRKFDLLMICALSGMLLLAGIIYGTTR